MHLTEKVRELLTQRPNARVLVMEATLEDVDATIGWFSKMGIRSGQDATDQILVYTPKYFQRHKRKCWPIDVVFVHNQHNMARTDRASSYKNAVQSINAQRQKVTWEVVAPDPILGLGEILVQGWECGEPYIMNARYFELSVPYSDLEPCGHRNPAHVWYCEACGRFRGLLHNERF